MPSLIISLSDMDLSLIVRQEYIFASVPAKTLRNLAVGLLLKLMGHPHSGIYVEHG